MEREQLLDMIKLYKQLLADATEEKMAYQVIINGQSKKIQELQEYIDLLTKQEEAK